MVDDDDVDVAKNSFYGQFLVDANNQYKNIRFRLSPALNPVISRNYTLPNTTGWFVDDDLFKPVTHVLNPLVSIDYDKVIPEGNLNPPDMCLLNGTGLMINDTRLQYIAPTNPGFRWCQGNAIWSIRIGKTRDNGGGKEQNGFEIGLATNIPWGTTETAIPSTDVKFAVRVYKNTDDMAHIVPNADFSNNPVYVDNTGVVPTNPAPTDRTKSDTIVMTMIQPQIDTGSKIIKAELFRENSALTQLFSYNIPAGSEDVALYPYIAFFDGDADSTVPAQAHSPVVSLDPFEPDEYQPDSYIDKIKPNMENSFAGENVFKLTAGNVFDYTATGMVGLPVLDDNWFLNKGISQTSFLQAHNPIFDFLGFGYNQLTSVSSSVSKIPFIINTTLVPYGFTLSPDNVFAISNSDNYVVILDSQKLISYECSKPATSSQSRSIDVVGKRANILATIPVNNSTGIVEFSANEVLYIDFDNKGETAIRNLRLRVLDKSLQPILVEGMSVMTLLIKDE